MLRFPYAAGDTRITTPGIKVVELPAGSINHHWTKNLIASPDETKLYVTVGSNGNVAERGMEVEAERVTIWDGGHPEWRVPYLCILPAQPEWLGLGASQRGIVDDDERARRYLGSDLVPDYLTSGARRWLLRLALRLLRPSY